MKFRVTALIFALNFIISCGEQGKNLSAEIPAGLDLGDQVAEKAETNTRSNSNSSWNTGEYLNTGLRIKPGLSPFVELKPEIDKSPLGGERPAKVVLPRSYKGTKKIPLIVLLHGYGATGPMQDFYLGLSRHVDDRNYALVIPNGIMDEEDSRFWNASEWCCDFFKKQIDDVSYITGLIDEAKSRYLIDERKVYFVGHSNGGFMSYRMACEKSDMITGIVSLAGTSFIDPARCNASSPVSVLQVHGTKDTTIVYEGYENRYPGAVDTVKRWVKRNDCVKDLEEKDPVDIAYGKVTRVKAVASCAKETAVELWTIDGGSHIPGLSKTFTPKVLDWLLSKEK